MKRILLIFALMLSIIPSLSFGASDNVYVIEISGEVNPGMLNYVRENIEDANNKNADLILFEVDTLGGRIDSAEKISQEILKSKEKSPRTKNAVLLIMNKVSISSSQWSKTIFLEAIQKMMLLLINVNLISPNKYHAHLYQW